MAFTPCYLRLKRDQEALVIREMCKVESDTYENAPNADQGISLDTEHLMKKVSPESAPYNTSQRGNLSHHEEASETCSFHSKTYGWHTPPVSLGALRQLLKSHLPALYRNSSSGRGLELVNRLDTACLVTGNGESTATVLYFCFSSMYGRANRWTMADWLGFVFFTHERELTSGGGEGRWGMIGWSI